MMGWRTGLCDGEMVGDGMICDGMISDGMIFDGTMDDETVCGIMDDG